MEPQSPWQGTWIESDKNGFAYVFHSQSNVPYVFLECHGQGFHSKVQLVMNTRTAEVVVQKVSNKQQMFKGELDQIKLPKDREIRMLDRLNALVRCPINEDAKGLNPRWPTYISYEAAPRSVTTGGQVSTVAQRVSYWTLCNGGCLADWSRSCKENAPKALIFPVSIVARCIAQVCETLEFMYTADSESIYHCDLHLSNVFVHFNNDNCELPDFLIGDLGLTRTASESLADTLETEEGNGLSTAPGPVSATAPCDIPPIGQRRQWDAGRFIACLEDITRDIFRTRAGEQSEELRGIRGLISLAAWLNSQEATLAARNPSSRPPSLRPIIDKAKMLEEAARVVESNTEAYKTFIAFAKARREKMFGHKKPFVVSVERGEAEQYGHRMIVGPWSLVKT